MEKNYKIAKKGSLESDDMIIKILLRLPARSIARFKSVCKQWHRLISDPSFSPRYQDRNHSFLGFFYGVFKRIKFSPVVVADQNPQGSFEFLSRPPRHFVRLVNSSNGLLLSYCFNGGLDEAEKLYILGNPVTGEEFDLPLPPLQSDYLYSSFFAHGFAFDHSSNPPHLIVTELIDGKEGLRVNTFSSYTCNWRSREHDLVPLLGENFTLVGPSTYLNGAFHWLSQSSIVAYNIKSENFSMINAPETMDRRYYSGILEDNILHLPYIYLGESRERLVYIRVSAYGELSLWILEDYYCGNWYHKYHIFIGSLLGLLRPWPVAAFDPRDAVVYLNLKWKIVPCHLEGRELKELDIILDYPDNFKFRGYPCPYGLPRSPPSIPPHRYFSALFGTAFNHQTVLGTHNIFGQSEAWFSTSTLSKRLRFEGASSLPIYPQRPREKDCAHYMRTRTCKFGDRCIFNHPLWVPEGGIQRSKKLGLCPTIYPQRSRLKCDFYMKTGKCKFGERYMFLHPIDRSAPTVSVRELALQQNVKLTLEGLPIRKNAICPWYLKDGTCQNGGITCRSDHRPPDEIIAMVTMQGTSTSVDGEVEERG